MDNLNSHHEVLPYLFRQEYAKMTAVMCRHFGLRHIEIAEDIASDTFLKASENWAVNGVPANPIAWLYTVAKNQVKDYFKHSTIIEKQTKEARILSEIEAGKGFEFDHQIISDSQLAMIFAVCNPANSTKAQICLALQILCSFSVEEISNAFLTKKEVIKKRLQRARKKLRNDTFQIATLKESDIHSRFETVLRTLYLLFNEGYFSKTNSQLIRKELCSEALRLALILTEHPITNQPQTSALLALMCFQSSRLDARAIGKGEAILFEKQDRNLWDSSLIEKGNYYLINACTGYEISKYHLEAAIAYWHTTVTTEKKWQHILQKHNQLIQIENSPITALNRIFVLAKVYGHEKAIIETEKFNMVESNYYHALLGYLYSNTQIAKAITYYQIAIDLTKSRTEKQTLTIEIERLKKGSSK